MVVDKEQPRRLLYRKEEVGRGFVSVGLQMRLLSFLLGNGKVKWSNSKKCRAFSLLRCVNREIAPWVSPRAELKRCPEQRCAGLSLGKPKRDRSRAGNKTGLFRMQAEQAGFCVGECMWLGPRRERERERQRGVMCQVYVLLTTHSLFPPHAPSSR